MKTILTRLSAFMLADTNRKIADIERQNAENDWAQVFHDSIRGREYLQNLPLNVGRWAGGYPFFYVLNRILHDFKPKRILEFGLGESSKFISTTLDHFLADSQHLIIEHDKDWMTRFEQNFILSARSEIQIHRLLPKEVEGYTTLCYDGIMQVADLQFDLYVIDGPFGSDHFSRYDIVEIARKFNPGDQFIIMLDDFQRPGEQQTFEALTEIFKNKNLEIHTAFYRGIKDTVVIGTSTYRYVTSL